MAHGFIGLLSGRPDGGAWLLADPQTVLQVGPDASVQTFGSLDVPFADSDFTDISVVGVTDSQGAFVLAGTLGQFLRVAEDGPATGQTVSVPVAARTECFSAGIAATSAGEVVLADYRCSRLLTFTPSGEVRTVDLRPEQRRGVRLPAGVLALPGGPIWFTAIVFDGRHISSLETVIGRVDPDGSVTQLSAPNAAHGPSGLAAAPDGTPWSVIQGACALYRVRHGRVERVNAPFRVYGLQFEPDGSAWLQGWSRLAHLSAAELNASRPPRRCDTTAPRLTFPTVKHVTPILETLSLRTLRRSGFRVTSNEPAVLSGYVRFADEQVYVHQVIRRAGGATTVRFPRAVLHRAALRVRKGRRVEVYFNAELRDSSGNGWIRPGPFRLVR